MIKPKIMGVVNATPDSFSDGGRFVDRDAGVAYALKLASDGAEILDIGGESTRPGALDVTLTEELERVLPIIEGVRDRIDIPISIDTRKAKVAEAAFSMGASIWNDVSALTYDEDSIEVAARLKATVVLMHAQGTPDTMQDNPCYDNVIKEVHAFLQARINECHSANIDPAKIIVDPGIGFGKTLEHNLILLKNLKLFGDLAPVLLGVSRKRFIAAIDRDGAPADRLGGSIAAMLKGASADVAYVRVHDVAETRQALNVWAALEGEVGAQANT
ncbi:MAG: dihydropteroate synthase [Pseudomonadota bacterium]